jgi:kynurenine formamidase
MGRIAADVLDGADLADLDFVLLRTGWERHWGTPRYYRDWPWLEPALAERLAGAGLRGVGLDSPSVDPLDEGASHERLAAGGLINVENLANLDRLPDGPFLFMAFPLRLQGAEASPVRAVALL